MKEVKLKGLDQTCYLSTLKNNLDIILVPYENKKNYFITYATRYGSDTNSFVPYNSKKEITVPNGIAHFLEHKCFEQEDGIDPFAFFSESGTGANASTSFDSTQYICYGTKEFNKNLRFLLKYVNEPYFTDENVLKEKGIIKEEIKMYEDIPESVLENKIRENLYHVHPHRIDIAGKCSDIDKITKEDLYTCYNTFYNPNNMFIIIAGNFDKDDAMSIIKEELDKKENRIDKYNVKDYKEPKTVYKEEDELSVNIKVPKIALGYKFATKDLKITDDLELDLYLSMFTTIVFGSSSLFRERVRNKKLMTSFYTEWDHIKDYRSLLIYSETENPELLIDEVNKEFKNISIEKEDFERIKKVWIANEVKMIDYVETTVNNMYDDMIRYRKVVSNKVDLIRKMNLKTLESLIENMNFNNRSKVILLPMKIITKKK